MKKAILITVGAIAGTTSLVSAGVFLPSLFLNSSASTVQVKTNDVFVSNKAKSSVSVKEAVMGTTKVNNGNYVLYFGSEGIDSNFKFLYNVPKHQTDVKNEQTRQLEYHDKKLSGHYWTGINYVMNNVKAKEDMIQPEFISYVNLLGNGVTDGRERVAQEATDCLIDVLNARKTYKDMSKEDKKIIDDKYNFLKTIILSNATLTKYLDTDIKKFYANLDFPFSKFEPTYHDKTIKLYDVMTWKVFPANIALKTNPFDTYQTWDQKTKFYDESSYTQEFRDLWDFIKNNPLFTARPPKDINTNNGFILGYKDGKLTDFYDDSFESPKTEDTESKPESQASYKINEVEVINESTTTDAAPEPNQKNTFYSWMFKCYSKKKNQ